MKNKGIAYLLWACTLLSLGLIHGLHYFYLGKYGKGIVWLLTLGLLGIGSFIDLFTLGGQVDQINAKQELKELRSVSLSNAHRDR